MTPKVIAKRRVLQQVMNVSNSILTKNVVRGNCYESQAVHSLESHEQIMKVSIILPVYNSASFVENILLRLSFYIFFLCLLYLSWWLTLVWKLSLFSRPRADLCPSEGFQSMRPVKGIAESSTREARDFYHHEGFFIIF